MNDAELMGIIREGLHPLEPLETGMHPRGRPAGEVEGLLLDVYGTLLISGTGDISLSEGETGCDGRLRGLLDRHGVSLTEREVQTGFARSVREVHRRSIAAGVDVPEVRVEEIWMDLLGLPPQEARCFAVEYETIVNPVWPMPGLDTLIGRVRERRAGGKFAAGIISNAQFFTPLQLECILGAPPQEWGFDEDLLFYSYRSGHAKPSAVMYGAAREALARRSIAAERVVYMGNDMRNDMLPARGAGFQTALFAGDRRSLRLREEDDRCRALLPDMIVTGLAEFAGLL